MSAARGLLLVATLTLAACSHPVEFPIRGMSANGFRHTFEALGAYCRENPAGIDSGWSVYCGSTRESGDQISPNFAQATGGGGTQIAEITSFGLRSSAATLVYLNALAAVPYEGADPPAAQAWVEAHLDDPACRAPALPGCSLVIGQAKLHLVSESGVNLVIRLVIASKDFPH